MLSSINNIQRLLMNLPADAVLVISGGSDQKIQRLHSRIAAAFGHYVVELAIRLRMQLVEHHAVSIEAVLVANIGRKHLIDTAGRLEDEPLGSVENFNTFRQSWTHPHHIRRHIENDGGLVSVSCTAINLGALLIVAASQQQGDSSRELTFAHLLWYLYIGRIELPVTVGFQCSKDVTDNLFLPVNKLEWLSGPCAFGVTERFYERHSVVGGFFVIGRILRFEARLFVLFQFSQWSPPPFGHKNRHPPVPS